MLRRKLASELSIPGPARKFHTWLTQVSNSRSCVTPRSSVIGSNLVWPGRICGVLGSPPSRNGVASVLRFSGLHLLTAATYFPFHFRRNLKLRYGSGG